MQKCCIMQDSHLYSRHAAFGRVLLSHSIVESMSGCTSYSSLKWSEMSAARGCKHMQRELPARQHNAVAWHTVELLSRKTFFFSHSYKCRQHVGCIELLAAQHDTGHETSHD